jgi:hypothetical protein
MCGWFCKKKAFMCGCLFEIYILNFYLLGLKLSTPRRRFQQPVFLDFSFNTVTKRYGCNPAKKT